MAFEKVLIANRGEIAARIARSAKALGLRTVAVYSEADAGAAHLATCDEAVAIGGLSTAESYLDQEKILEACRVSGAQAVHPGYGFLAENADFARRCHDARIVFVGPPVEAIALMGNKAEAKRRMVQAGVPCVPGYQGHDQSDAVLREHAAEIGYPLMVKAAAGGGGRGMRLVTSAAGLDAALQSARSEARNAFGSDELILERAVLHARHVEVQVMADGHGHVIHLGERDCSAQRRHQKVIEEAPCSVMTESLRAAMGHAAVQAAQSIGYMGAGTVEFLLAEDGQFYFLEMNTRIQVEHPVTELVTGLDLVAWQLRVAAGEKLTVSQEQVTLQGWAMEARLYAEDPFDGFVPQTGTVLDVRWPQGEGIRVDQALAAGMAVTPYYDPMLAKVIAWGPDRDAARRRLLHALEDAAVLGVGTNRAFLQALLRHPVFVAGKATTDWIDGQLMLDPPRRPEASEVLWALAAVLFHVRRAAALPLAPGLRYWCSALDMDAPIKLSCRERIEPLRIRAVSPNVFQVSRGEQCDAVQEVATIRLLAPGHAGVISFADGAGHRNTVHAAWETSEVLHLAATGFEGSFRDVLMLSPAQRGGTASGHCMAPMAGKILAVKVEPGARVKKGQALCIIEAMKMEMEVPSPIDGVVQEVLVQPGLQVKPRTLMVRIEPAGQEAA